MKAISVSQPGGPERLELAEKPVPEPGAGEVLIRVKYSGVNFIDVYHRTGLYKLPLPFTPGSEAAGEVQAVGEGVTGIVEGDRVAYAMAIGSYAEYAAVPASKIVPVPEGVELRQAAALMLQGMTAHYLTHSTYPLKAGDTCLVHAAAGGTGLLITQLAKRQGARVIGTVSTEAKAEESRKAGADDVIIYTKQDFGTEVKRLTSGRGVDVVYDSVGVTTFADSLNCIRPRGMMVAFGQSSGPVPPFDILQLNQKGSLFLTRPSLAHHALTREEVLWRAGDLFRADLNVRIQREYPLAEAGAAHRDLESRRTMGKLLLIN